MGSRDVDVKPTLSRSSEVAVIGQNTCIASIFADKG